MNYKTKILFICLFISLLLAAGAICEEFPTRSFTKNEFESLVQYFGIYDLQVNYAKIIHGHGTGLVPPTREEWKSIKNEIRILDMSRKAYLDLKASIDNSATNWFPPIGNQGSENSCVAWATGYYTKTFQEAKEHNWDLSGCQWTGGSTGHPTTSYQDRIFSPDFIYHQINNGVDLGSKYYDAGKLLYDIGCCSWEKMPYSPSNHYSWPDEEAWYEAPLYRSGTSMRYINLFSDTNLVNLKQLLSSENLGIIRVNADCYSDLSSDDLWTLDNYGGGDENHVNTIVGYDDDFGPYIEAGSDSVYGAFKVANSWGVGGWENVPDGFYYISYQCLKDSMYWVGYYENRIGYEPELVSVFKLSHDKRGECFITLGIGDTLAPDLTKNFNNFFYNGGNHPFPSNNIVFDITEFMPYTNNIPTPYYLNVLDSGSTTVGTIDSFYVEYYDDYASGTPIQTLYSYNTPLITEHDTTVYALIEGNNVSGIFSSDYSPYYIYDDLTVLYGQELIIDPGVEVIFMDTCKIDIYGRLVAEGTPSDSICFIAQDTTAGWKGLRFNNLDSNPQDSTVLKNCKFEYSKNNYNFGGAIHCSQTSKLMIEDCFIQYCQSYSGGGIYLYNNSNPIIKNVSLFYNTAITGGGIQCQSGSSPYLENLNIKSNVAYSGGGLCISGSSNPTINNCLIENNIAYNYGGGIYCSVDVIPLISNTKIINNNCNFEGGGIYCTLSAHPVLKNVLIANNVVSNAMCSYGGGICCDYNCDPTLINVTMSNNSSAYMGGAIYCRQNSDISGINCIFWDDYPNEIILEPSSSAIISYSDIEGGWTGTGNIDEDPQFKNPDSLNFRLSENSPCINTGTPDTTGLHLPLWDLDGNPRIYDGRIDMGCYEWQGVGVEDWHPYSKNILYQNFPNPFSSSTTISFSATKNAKDTKIKIYNIKGRLVKTLECPDIIGINAKATRSLYSISWKGRDENGNQLSNGIYLYQLKAGNYKSEIKKMILIR
ncbi:MAG: T9SS type A sorting domain-containing protein [Candidatus Cloacimonetes bacterium]|nr:T9SS type A sorting domain-containing protein [Candidatus Cloacimonadota bacterium]